MVLHSIAISVSNNYHSLILSLYLIKQDPGITVEESSALSECQSPSTVKESPAALSQDQPPKTKIGKYVH